MRNDIITLVDCIPCSGSMHSIGLNSRDQLVFLDHDDLRAVYAESVCMAMGGAGKGCGAFLHNLNNYDRDTFMCSLLDAHPEASDKLRMLEAVYILKRMLRAFRRQQNGADINPLFVLIHALNVNINTASSGTRDLYSYLNSGRLLNTKVFKSLAWRLMNERYAVGAVRSQISCSKHEALPGYGDFEHDPSKG